MQDLATLQGWMQAAIVDAAASTAGEISSYVRSDSGLAADARLGIYARSYRLRLLECLRQEYPVLQALVGPTVFELFAHGYCAARPSRSYTLYDFGAGFPDYLDAARPRDDGTPWAIEAIPSALARIERAKAEAGRARGVEWEARRRPPDHSFDPFLASVLGFDRGTIHARPDSLHLLALPFDFAQVMSAVERGERPPLPEVTPSFVAITRVQYRVEYHRLEAWQHAWLAGLPGMDDTSPGAPPEPGKDPQLAAWLPFAMGHGMIVVRAQEKDRAVRGHAEHVDASSERSG